MSVRPVLCHVQFWIELLVSGRNFRTRVLFRLLLFKLLAIEWTITSQHCSASTAFSHPILVATKVFKELPHRIHLFSQQL